MNKVLFVISAMNGGGAERVISTLANYYVRHGDQAIILMVAGDESAYPLDPKVEILSIGQPSRGRISTRIKRLWDMRQFFKKHKGYAIVSFGKEINMFTILATRGLKNKVILSEREDPHRCGFVKLRNRIYSMGGKFVFQTEDAKDFFPEKIRKNSCVIPNPIPSNLPEPYLGEREKKIAAVGRFVEEKDYPVLLKAFAAFHKNYPEYTLHFLGKGPLEEMLKQKARELGIEHKIVWEGFKKDVQEYIKSFGMYVLSSKNEGIPNALLEAMAMGVPCIATNCPIGGPKLCIENEKNGLLVPVGDWKKLQGAMERLASDAAFAKKLGSEAIQIRDRFCEDKIIRMWNEVIKNEKNSL